MDGKNIDADEVGLRLFVLTQQLADLNGNLLELSEAMAIRLLEIYDILRVPLDEDPF